MVEKYPEPQRVQSSATFKFWSGKAQKLQSRIQMTRIFKDPRASVQFVFHSPLLFSEKSGIRNEGICVYSRLSAIFY